MTIHILSPETVARIRAGEVVDRPASIVKELIENALDADATKIVIDIWDGGKAKLSISDNGTGISPADLPLAPLKHATSKITDFDDVFQIVSLGFRGEALASIGHVASLKLMSKSQGGEAYEISVVDGVISELSKTAHPQGTTVVVSDLFGTIPVRRGYLKSAATEFSYIYDQVLAFALIHPDVDFVLTHDHKEMLNTTGVSDPKTLLVLLFGKGIKAHLIDKTVGVERLLVRGIVTSAQLTFPNRNKQWFSVNGRPIKSAMLQKAVMQGYRDVIVPGRFPLVLIWIGLPPVGIDANIHPQKHEIKFLSPGPVFDALQAFFKSVHQQEHEVIGGTLSGYSPSLPSPQEVQQTLDLYSSVSTGYTVPTTLSYLHVFDTYIFLKTPEGIWVLDQHAVHERILYEKIKIMWGNWEESQLLIGGDIVRLRPDQYSLAFHEQAYFREMGVTFEDFGQYQIKLCQVPLFLQGLSLPEFFDVVLDGLKTQDRADMSLAQKEKLQMMACKAAIKAGNKMSEPEIRQLLLDFQASPANFTCPHGRPLFIKLDKPALEKLFLRR